MATVLTRTDAIHPHPRPQIVTVEMVGAMLEEGALDGLRVELIDGELVEMPPQNSPHLAVRSRLAERLLLTLRQAGSDLMVTQDGCFAADDANLPEPDVMVWAPNEKSGFAQASQIRLAVEVCLTSHRRDFVRKVGLYATAGVPEYWVADLASRSIVVMTSPARGLYTQRAEWLFGMPVTSPTLGVTIETGAL